MPTATPTAAPAAAPTQTPAPTPQKMTVDQFAQTIKTKYPAYNSVDNTTLVQKVLTKYPQYADRVDMGSSSGAAPPAKYDIPYAPVGGAMGTVINSGVNIANTVKDAAVGFGTDVMKAGFGAAALATKAAGKLGVPGATDYANKQVAADPIGKATSGMTNTIPGEVGQVAGEAALFAAPGGVITKGQKAAEAGVDALNIGGKVIPWIAQKFAQAVPEVVGSGGTQYVKSGGDQQSAVNVGLTAGVLSTLTHVGADAFAKLVPQTVKDNVAGFLKYTGKTTLKDVATSKKVDDAVSAFTTMVRNAPSIKVIDENGVSKTWDPAKTGAVEIPQALYQTKNAIYKVYTDMATKTGDLKAMFQQSDFTAAKASLSKFSGPGYSSAESAQAKKWMAAIDRYGTPNPQDKGNIYFKNTPPKDIQTLLETVNKAADPRNTDAATAVVANDFATTLRESLDKKITASTGPGYKQLRTAYSQLKTVEKDVIERSKVALRQTGGVADIIDGLASIDVLQGILTGNPQLAVRGGAIATTKAFVKYMRSPEVKIQRALRMLQTGQEGGASGVTPGGLTDRFFGKATAAVPAVTRTAAAETP